MLADRRDSAGGLGKASRGQRDVGGDADIGGGDPLGDPVIRRVRRGVDNDHADVRQARRANRTRTIGDDEDGQTKAGRHAVGFLADRASIGVDIDRSHDGLRLAANASDCHHHDRRQPDWVIRRALPRCADHSTQRGSFMRCQPPSAFTVAASGRPVGFRWCCVWNAFNACPCGGTHSAIDLEMRAIGVQRGLQLRHVLLLRRFVPAEVAEAEAAEAAREPRQAEAAAVAGPCRTSSRPGRQP